MSLNTTCTREELEKARIAGFSDGLWFGSFLTLAFLAISAGFGFCFHVVLR